MSAFKPGRHGGSFDPEAYVEIARAFPAIATRLRPALLPEVELTCPCGKSLTALAELVADGREVYCPHCRKAFAPAGKPGESVASSSGEPQANARAALPVATFAADALRGLCRVGQGTALLVGSGFAGSKRWLLKSSGWLVSAVVHSLLLVMTMVVGLEGYKGLEKSDGVFITEFTPEAQKEEIAQLKQRDIFKINPEVDAEAAAGNLDVKMPEPAPETHFQNQDQDVADPEDLQREDPLPTLEAAVDALVDVTPLSSPEDLPNRAAAPVNAGMGDGRVTPPGPFTPVVAVQVKPRGQDGTGGSRGPEGLRGSGRGATSRQASDSTVGKMLHRHWERYINKQVSLPKPSGWHFHYPWFVSSPAVGDLTSSPGLEVVTGTEEGIYEYFPLGQGQGRYICTAADGKKLWEYRTDNNAGRASPAIAAVQGTTSLQVLGGSTSGWMVHCFDAATGKRAWRHNVSGAKANILAAPAAADFLTRRRGLEIVAIALNGTVVAIDARGKRIWTKQPFGREEWAPNCAAAALADIDGDGRIEALTVLVGRSEQIERVVTVINGKAIMRTRRKAMVTSVRVTAFDAASGKVRWQQDFLPDGKWAQAQPRGVPPLPSPAVVPGSRRAAVKGKTPPGGLVVFAFCGQLLVLDGRDGEVKWKTKSTGPFASPAVGDLDGDGQLEVAAAAGGELMSFDLEDGKLQWKTELVKEKNVPIAYRNGKPPVFLSGPALAARHTGQPGRIEWGMFRHDAARTGVATSMGPHDIYVAGCDGKLYTVLGRDGRLIGRQKLAIPQLHIRGSKVGALPYVSSPAVADIDGDGVLEVLVTMVDRLWCLKDTGSGSMPRDFDSVLVMARKQKRPVVLVLDSRKRRCPGSFSSPGLRRAAGRSKALLAVLRMPVCPKPGDRRAQSSYQRRLKRYKQIAKMFSASVDPTLICLTSEGLYAGKVEHPSAPEVASFFLNAPAMAAAATAALAARTERAASSLSRRR
jgi:outer membrane protein assembly factor BamB